MNQQQRDDRNVLLTAARCGDIGSIKAWLSGAKEDSKEMMEMIAVVAIVNGHDNVADICDLERWRSEARIQHDSTITEQQNGDNSNNKQHIQTRYDRIKNNSGYMHCPCHDESPNTLCTYDDMNVAAEYGLDLLLAQHCSAQTKDSKNHKPLPFRTLRCAARNGHVRCVRLLLEKCSCNLCTKHRRKHKETIDNAICDAICDAAREGHFNVVKLFKNHLPKNFDFTDVICQAAINGHVNIIELCKKWGDIGDDGNLHNLVRIRRDKYLESESESESKFEIEVEPVFEPVIKSIVGPVIKPVIEPMIEPVIDSVIDSESQSRDVLDSFCGSGNRDVEHVSGAVYCEKSVISNSDDKRSNDIDSGECRQVALGVFCALIHYIFSLCNAFVFVVIVSCVFCVYGWFCTYVEENIYGHSFYEMT